ncbi:anti-sigma B factor RsbW [Paenibacillus harenae]|uniref:anti-sigma B factor RsbW n=1 Tax=Paenibacillus harenae TaxID=306543 RepID=UPI0027909EFD|nr:anti-sigma B factor RsbW [Paenibacillus harenae]MDQ0060359.1 serine/threonine-protein kinase RsbW [Paenibacillus harenae]
MKAIRLQIPAHADFIDMVRICLYGIASKMKFSYEDIEDMKVAVSEACNNAVLHGGLDTGDEVIDVCYETDDDSLKIRIKNNGSGFVYPNALDMSAPLAVEQVSDLRVGGLGIYLIQALMDEVAIYTTGNVTEVVMTKYLTAVTEEG